MSRNSKVVKFHNVPSVNIGLIIFGLIFIFIVIQVIRSINQEHISIYEIQKSYIDSNITGTALILRNEELVNTSQAGYVNYYIRNGEKVGKNATVYTLDSTGNLSDLIAEESTHDTKINSVGYAEIRSSISSFQNYFSNVNFSDVYDFKYDLESQVLDIANTQVLEELTSGDNALTSFSQISATQSGIITYYQDGFESKKPESVTMADFDMNNYKKQSLKTGEILQSGTPVYKLITSEYWNLILPLSEDDANRLKEDTRVTMFIPSISHEVYGDIELIQNGGDTFAKITLDKLMVNYCDERFLPIEIVMDKEEGLSVPNTAILEKSVIKLPQEYMVAGSNSSARKNVNVRILDEEGNLSITQVSPTIYDKDEDYYYINPDDFSADAVLVKNNSDETLIIAQAPRIAMKGVYNINRGVATFQKVTIQTSDEEFSIIDDSDDYSVSMFDRIVLDASFVEEGSLIH